MNCTCGLAMVAVDAAFRVSAGVDVGGPGPASPLAAAAAAAGASLVVVAAASGVGVGVGVRPCQGYPALPWAYNGAVSLRVGRAGWLGLESRRTSGRGAAL